MLKLPAGWTLSVDPDMSTGRCWDVRDEKGDLIGWVLTSGGHSQRTVAAAACNCEAQGFWGVLTPSDVWNDGTLRQALQVLLARIHQRIAERNGG